LVIGGENSSGFLNDVYRYNPRITPPGQWSAVDPMPAPRVDHSAIRVGDRVFVLGGRNGTGALTSVWSYNVVTALWSVMGATLTTAVSNAAIATDGRRIYLIGGDSGGAPSDAIQVYDTSTDLFVTGGRLPSARRGLAAGFLNGELVVAGGIRTDTSVAATTFHLSPADLTGTSPLHEPLFSMPEGRGHSAYVVLGGRLWMFGGKTSSSDSGTVLFFKP
jgi:N-acetylneuraminic acid mutarotase